MRVNKLPGLNYLCLKKVTQFLLDKFKSYYPNRFKFQPESYRIPEDNAILEKIMSMHHEKKTGKIFIAKPTKSQQGKGIVLIQKFNGIPRINSTKYVV